MESDIIYNNIYMILGWNSLVPWKVLDKHTTVLYNIFTKIYYNKSCKISIVELYNYYRTNTKFINSDTFDLLFDYLLMLVIDRSKV